MIKEFRNYILSYLRTIYLFESSKNKKKLNFKGFKLLIFRKFQSIKDKNLKNLLNKEKKKRLRDNQLLLVLYFKNHIVTTGWMMQGTKWYVAEIDKEIEIKNKILLYDFFTSERNRNRGYYAKLLKLIKNYNTKKNFWIYCLSNNYSSKKGIENSNFKLLKKIKK